MRIYNKVFGKDEKSNLKFGDIQKKSYLRTQNKCL